MKFLKENLILIILIVIFLFVIFLVPNNTQRYNDQVCKVNGYQSDCKTKLNK